MTARLHPITTLVALCGAATAATAALPTYTDIQLLARTGFSDAYRVPNTASSGQYIDINDNGTVVFRVIGIGDNQDQGVWYGTPAGGSVLTTHDTATGASINNAGVAAWVANFNSVWRYNPASPPASLLTSAPFGGGSFTPPHINASGKIGYRATVSGIMQAGIYNPATDAFVTYVTQPSPPVNNNQLNAPVINDNDHLALKLFLGDATDGTLREEIRLYTAPNTFTVIASDVDVNPSSPFKSFENSVALNNNGYVAFIANRVGGGRGVYLSNGTSTITIGETGGTSILTGIDSFAPRVNNNNVVAFRGVDFNNDNSVFVGDGTSLAVVIGANDLLPNPLDTGETGSLDPRGLSNQAIVGDIAINDHGDIAFAALVETAPPPPALSVDRGTAFFVAVAERPGTACRADFDQQNGVQVADIFAFLRAWFANAPSADFDQQNGIQVADIFAFLRAWFAGCP